MGVWAIFDLLLLAAGAVALSLSLVWRADNPSMNMVLTSSYLTTGTVLGFALLFTFGISVGAIVQKNHVTIGLVILNYALLFDALGIVAIGTYIWLLTLQERATFHHRWFEATPDTRIKLQDQFKCCGFFNGTDLVEIGGSFCQTQDFVNNLQADVTSNFCVTPITDFADTILHNIFTTVYGFMAIVLCLLLASLCIMKKRQEDERFKRIDAKRGRAFV